MYHNEHKYPRNFDREGAIGHVCPKSFWGSLKLGLCFNQRVHVMQPNHYTLFILTLYIDMSVRNCSCIQKIFGHARVRSRGIPPCFQHQVFSSADSYSIFYPQYLWNWITNGSTVQFHLLIFKDCLIGRPCDYLWWNYKQTK